MDGPDRPTSRRALLGGVGTAIVGGLAGCAGVVGQIGRAPPMVSVLAAGSLAHLFETRLREAVQPHLQIEAHGSATVARLVADGQRDPDVVALADTGLFGRLLPVPFYATVATNALVLAYNPRTAGGRRVRDADAPFAPFRADDPPALGRTDPDLDPLGYRTRFALELAGARADDPALAREVLAGSRVYPETELLARFETGAVDAAVVYRTMAAERGYPSRILPAGIDLSAPDMADHYATRSYRLPDGTVVDGDVIRYGATLRRTAPAPTRVFEALADGGLLAAGGFEVPDRYPEYVGDVPERLRD